MSEATPAGTNGFVRPDKNAKGVARWGSWDLTRAKREGVALVAVLDGARLVGFRPVAFEQVKNGKW